MRWGSAGDAYLRNSRLARVDVSILLVSLLDVVAQASGLAARYSSVNALRTVRAFRVLRLVRLSSGAMAVFDRIAQAIPAAVNALALLIVFMVTFALVGMQVGGRECRGGGCSCVATDPSPCASASFVGLWRGLRGKPRVSAQLRGAAPKLSGVQGQAIPTSPPHSGTHLASRPSTPPMQSFWWSLVTVYEVRGCSN